VGEGVLKVLARSLARGLVGALILCAALPLRAAPSAEAPLVLAVEIRAEEGWKPPERLAELVSVRAGEPLDSEDLRQSLRSLRSALEASEVEAHLVRHPAGVEVVFALWTGVRVSEVRLDGELCIKESVLRNQLDQRAEAPLSESRVLRGLYRLQDMHFEAGYREARVRLDVSREPGVGATVGYQIECGAVATVGSVAFEGGLSALSPDELAELVSLGVGDRFADAFARDDAERLEERLIVDGFRLARVDEPRTSYNPDSGQIHLSYPIEVGPAFEVKLSGADASELERAGVMPLSGTTRYDEALLLRELAALRSHYQNLGHYRVRIETREERSAEHFRLWLLIEPGPLFELDSLVTEGLERIVSEEVEALFASSPRRLLGVGGGRLVDEVLQLDLANVRAYLALQGFDRATVGPAEVEERGGKLAVRVPIVEGPQRRVVAIDFRGANSVPEDELRRLLRIEEGGPFHTRLLEDSLNRLRARYEELGYGRVQVAAALDWDEEQTLVNVDLRVLEGRRATVDRVVLRGNRRTRTGPLLRTVDLRPGDPVSRRDLLQVQRRLYSLGIFSSVEVELAPGPPLSGRRDVVVRVEEGKTRKVTYGFGWDSEDGARALLGYSNGNLFHRAVTGRLDLRWSEREQQARALFYQPYIGRLKFPTTYSLFAIEEMQDSFVSKRRGFQAESTRLGGRSQLNLLYTYKIVEVDPDDSLAALSPRELARVLDIDRDLAEVEISSLRPAWIVDRRDDPVVPTSGWSSTLSLEYAFPFLETEAEFVKGFVQQTSYLNFGWLGVGAASFRLGAIEPTGSGAGGVDRPDALPSRRVPISERFFAGGRTTHRAYRRDRLGIVGESLIESEDGALVSVGGNGLFLINLDWRFPIAGPIGGVVFADAGNVWADWRSLGVDELKLGVGGGLRYDSPIGPLRLEVGWKLDREEGESPAVLFLSFGNPF
jgi:outer membrane protein insertion porin family